MNSMPSMPSDQHDINHPAAEGQEVSAQAEYLTIKVTPIRPDEMVFKMKESTTLKKLMAAYCELQGTAIGSVRFIYEGIRVMGYDTPESLEMEDGDTIEVDYLGMGSRVTM